MNVLGHYRNNLLNQINTELGKPLTGIIPEELFGSKIVYIKGLEEGSIEVIITVEKDDGTLVEIIQSHDQDCCEYVAVEQVDNAYQRHIGAKLFGIEEKVSTDIPSDFEGFTDDSNTWTFYDIKTSKGYISYRWHGASNGYYSESVETTIRELTVQNIGGL